MNIEKKLALLKQLIGKPCCRKRVNLKNKNMLSLGFGKKIFHKKKRKVDNYYGEWEIGTYNSSWKISCYEKKILSSQDEIVNIDDELQQIEMGSITKLYESNNKVFVYLDNGINIEFTPMYNDDESFHIFMPESYFIQFSPLKKWSIGKSNEPWDPVYFSSLTLP